jgi:hypothetical protein
LSFREEKGKKKGDRSQKNDNIFASVRGSGKTEEMEEEGGGVSHQEKKEDEMK